MKTKTISYRGPFSRTLAKAAAVFAVGVSLLGWAAACQAVSYFADEDPQIGSLGNAQRQTIGSRFTVLADPIRVTALGVFDHNFDGLHYSHDVGIWTADGANLLCSTTVPAGVGTLINGFIYADLSSPVLLAANSSYVIGAYYPAANDDYARSAWSIATNPDHLVFPEIPVDPAVWLEEPRYNAVDATPGLGFPNVADRTGMGFFGPSFAFEAVPEQGQVAYMILVPLVSSAVAGWRRKTGA